jgi:uncharacterized delta-60 repeat protein
MKLLFFVFFLCVAAVSIARPGDLDKSFGSGTGTSLTSFGASQDRVSSMAIQRDGKIVIAGTCGGTVLGNICLARYRVDGVLDSAFAVSGRLVVPDEPQLYASTYVRQVSIATDAADRIVVASECNLSFCVRRYLTSGEPDTSFGTAGISGPLRLGNDRDSIGTTPTLKLALMSDGKILVVSTCGGYVCASKLLGTGSPDTSFGAFGFRLSTAALLSQALVLSSGDVYFATGFCQEIVANELVQSHCTAKFDANGALIPEFGVSGILKGPVGLAWTNHVGADNKLYVAGECVSALVSRGCVLRYSASGEIDSSFGNSGVSLSGVGDYLNSLATDARGNILAAASCADESLEQRCAMRLTPSGALDNAFGDAGVVRLANSAYRDWFSNVHVSGRGSQKRTPWIWYFY